ncbi:hypothetical protein CCR75_003291 [Bremia lactucae]|uniref:Uncharacterized protein n=1 Tax=Bremia lactucae TaxID=4779 RepID=A0A976NXX3_BRELC|nr:hypothetical protein CCR75_003291 [Bremia lactucae]
MQLAESEQGWRVRSLAISIFTSFDWAASLIIHLHFRQSTNSAARSLLFWLFIVGLIHLWRDMRKIDDLDQKLYRAFKTGLYLAVSVNAEVSTGSTHNQAVQYTEITTVFFQENQ